MEWAFDFLETSSNGGGLPMLGSAGERLIVGMLGRVRDSQRQDRLIDEQLRAIEELTAIVREQLEVTAPHDIAAGRAERARGRHLTRYGSG